MQKVNYEKRFLYIALLVICFVGFGSLIYFRDSSASANSQKDSIWSITGKKVRKANAGSKSRTISPVVIKGKNITITEEEIKKQELLLSGNNKHERAKDLIKTRKVLYKQALKKGYTVSSKEIEAFKEQFEMSIKDDSEAEKSIEEFYNAYGGKDLYWTDMEETYKESLLIQKYLNSEKNLFLKSKKIPNNTLEADESWAKEEKKLTDRLVAEQNF